MTSQLSSALAALNAATNRTYSIDSDGGCHTLLIPSGGAYPPVDANAMLRRLTDMRLAAEGRAAQPAK